MLILCLYLTSVRWQKRRFPNPHSPTETVSPATCLPTPDQNCEHRAAPLMCGTNPAPLDPGQSSAQTSQCHTIGIWQQDCQLVDVSVSADSSAPCNPRLCLTLPHKGRQSCPFSTQRKQHPSRHLPTGPLTRETQQQPHSSHVAWLQLWGPQDQGQSYWFKDKAVDLYLLKSFCKF